MSKTQTRATVPLLIDEPSVSLAWGRMMRHVADHAGKQIAPAVVSIYGFGPNGEVPEDPLIRQRLDAALAAPSESRRYDIETVAFTIFPQRYWRMAQGDRKKLFAMYSDAAPRLMAMNPKVNGRGLYFQRLTQIGAGPCGGNQLEWIISQHRNRDGVRDSMFQATTFDPGVDHVANAQLPFPCLQQVSFVPTTAGLVVNAFYATQQLFDKAYGNYLGLAHLGSFMAREMDLEFARLNVTVGVAKLDRVSKTSAVLKPVFEAIDIALAACDEAPLAATG